MRGLPLGGLLAGVALGAAGLGACSGPLSHVVIARNQAIGYAGYVVVALVMIPLILLRTRRRGMGTRGLLPLFVLVTHPAWIVTTSDCAHSSAFLAYVWLGIGAAWLIYEVARSFWPGPDASWPGWVLCAGIAASAAAVQWGVDWTLNPAPVQSRLLRWEKPWRAADLQTEYKDVNGTFARSATELARLPGGANLRIVCVAHLDNGDAPAAPEVEHPTHLGRFLQGTQDDPTAWRVAGGLSDWALTLRPMGFPPESRPLYQYLVLADETTWRKLDPGEEQFLLDGLPQDLAAAGWERAPQR